MRREGKTSNIVISALITVAVIAICVFFTMKVKELNAQNAKTDSQVQKLNEEIKIEKDKEKELHEYSKYVNTKQFVELMARNKLGLVYPNEVIFKNTN